jgi:hypothetical protein
MYKCNVTQSKSCISYSSSLTKDMPLTIFIIIFVYLYTWYKMKEHSLQVSHKMFLWMRSTILRFACTPVVLNVLLAKTQNQPSTWGLTFWHCLSFLKWQTSWILYIILLYLKTHFGDWILSLSSGKTYSVGLSGSHPEIRTSSINWNEHSRFYLMTQTDSSFWNAIF